MALSPLRIGLAGLGTVGTGVVQILHTHASLLARRAGRPVMIHGVSARTRRRTQDYEQYPWFDDPVAMAQHPDIDCIVEVMGGSEGAALATVQAALRAGKSVVTANKALLAHHGVALAQQAEVSGVALKFEAAVAGGIPIIKALQEGLAANAVRRVYGILNGTCNYILTRMVQQGLSFAQSLAEAQAEGYAEADPSFDVDGVDTAHKLSLLAALAFGCAPDFPAVLTRGIRAVTAVDIAAARQHGYEIKLIGCAERLDEGMIVQSVAPTLVAQDQALAHVGSSLNGVVVEGDFCGSLFFQGRGAGGGPTASAVVADLIDIARGRAGALPFGLPVADLAVSRPASAQRSGAFYLRVSLASGADPHHNIAAALQAVGGVSLDRHEGEAPCLVAITPVISADQMEVVCRALADMHGVSAPPFVMPIWS